MSLSIAFVWRSDSAWTNCEANWNSRKAAIIRVVSSTGCTLLSSTAPCTIRGVSTGAVGVSARSVRPPSACMRYGSAGRTTPTRPILPFSLLIVPSALTVMCASPVESRSRLPSVSSSALPSASPMVPSACGVKRPARVSRGPRAVSTVK